MTKQMQICVKHGNKETFQEVLNKWFLFLLGLFIQFPASAKLGAFIQLYKTQIHKSPL